MAALRASSLAIRLAVLVALCWLLAACWPAGSGLLSGELLGTAFGRIEVAVTVPGSPVRAIQELPASIAKIKIRIDPVAGSPPFTPQELTLVASGDLTTQVFDGVPAGKVRVTAEVISAAGDVLGKNGQEIDVVKDEISQVQIVVNLKDLVAAAKVIRSVRVSTDSVVLNTMPETGGAETDLVASASVTATVVTDQGDDPGSGVIWSTTDPDRVTVIDGVIRARRESLEGTCSIIVTAVDDRAFTATISVTIARIGGLSMEVR